MNTRLFLGGVNVDLFDDVPITVNYALTDVMEPASRKVSHTKTIELPNTANNASIFKQLFVINKDNTINSFDPNLRVVAFVQNGVAALIEGYFQLTNIVRVNNDIKYQGVIYSDGKNLFSQMGDVFIEGNADSSQDVDLDTGTTPYTYDLSGYGQSVANAFVASSKGASLFIYDNGSNTTQSTYPYYIVPYTNLRMAIKFKHILDRIFTKYGQTYSSTFLNSTYFKSICYLDLHKTANLTTAQYNNIYASVKRSTDTGSLTNGNTLVFDTDVYDIGGRYNNTTGIYTSNSGRNYTFNLNASVKGRITFTAPTIIPSNTTENVFISIAIYKYATQIGIGGVVQVISIPAGSYAIGDFIEYNMSDIRYYSIPLTFTYDAMSVETFTAKIVCTNSTGYLSSSVKVLQNSTLTIKPTNSNLSAGDTYTKASVIANQHKQKDFIGDVLRMSNLYVLYDGINYIIEPRDTFFTLGVMHDWTNKIDRSQEINIMPIGQLNWKQITFKHAVDKDYYSDKYNTNYNEVYGQQDVFNNNEFISDTKTVELKFSPPLSVSTQPNFPKIPHCYKLNNGVAEAIDGLPRYGYWAGWKETTTVSHGVVGLTPTPGSGSGGTDYNGYPFVGEFDDPLAPTLSVLFGSPKTIYYQTYTLLGITTNDLYNTYYNNELNNQLSANAKIITCYVLLTPMEINNLKLYDTVIVDGVQCVISKISDYNTSTIQPVQVELIQYVR